MRAQSAYASRLLAPTVVLAVLLSITLLGQTLSESATGLNNCVTHITRPEMVGPVSETLSLDHQFVEKALLEKELQVSDLVFIKALAAKKAQTPEIILTTHTNQNWLAAIKEAGIDDKDLVQQLDDAYAELALKVMDLPKKHKHHPHK